MMSLRLSLTAVVLFAALAGGAHAQLRMPDAPRTVTVPSAGAAQPSSGGPRSGVADRIVAVVNNEPISQRELDRRVAEAQRMIQARGQTLPPAGSLAADVLEEMIVERSQLQAATQAGIRIDDPSVDRAIARIAENNRLSVSQLRDRIEAEGLPFRDYRESIRREIAMQAIREREVDSRVTVSEAEITAWLAEKQGSVSAGGAPVELRLAQILIRVPDGASVSREAELKARADALMARLRRGEDFGVLAREGQGEEAARGGDLGSRPADRWPDLFVQAVQGLRPGQIAGPLRSGAGFHILRLTERRVGDLPDIAAGPVQQTRARHILIRVDDVVLNDAQARERIAQLRQRIVQGGASFADLARQHSADGSAPQGGDLGWLSPGDTVPSFEQAMDALKPGEVSEPVRSPFGWHIIRVEERRMQDVTEERLRNLARQAIRQRKIQEAYVVWAQQVRDSAYVERRLDQEP